MFFNVLCCFLTRLMGVLMDLLDFVSKLCQKRSLFKQEKHRRKVGAQFGSVRVSHSQKHRNFEAFLGVGGAASPRRSLFRGHISLGCYLTTIT